MRFVTYGGARADILEQAASILRDNGYVVIPRERHVVVQATYMVPPHEIEKVRSGDHRWSDIALTTSLKKIALEAYDAGLVIHKRQDIADPICGQEVVFRTAMACIKPKAEDEV